MLVSDLPITIKFKHKADKILRKMDRHDSEKIMAQIREFSETGTPIPQALTGKLNGYYKLRFGNTRVVIRFEDKVCYVEDLGNRGSIYKR